MRELKRRLFPNDVEGILYSSIVGDLYWQDQLWSLMVETWPRLSTNLSKLKKAISRMDYGVEPYAEEGEDPTTSAIEKANFVEDALFGMHGRIAFQEHDFQGTLQDIVDSTVSGFTVMEVYWEKRAGGIVPQCTRWLPARYYRYPYVIDDVDRLMLNPSGALGGTQLFDFPDYKFLLGITATHCNHPVFSAPMRCLCAWWLASRFGLEWFMTYAQLFGIPRTIAYYQPGDTLVYQQLINLLRNAGARSWGAFPEGTKIETLAAAGATGHLPQERLIEEADQVCDIMLLGQTLTTEVRESGSRALGAVHKHVMDEIVEATAIYCAKQISTQIIPGIIQYNYGNLTEVPTLEPTFNTPLDLYQYTQSYNILFNQMRIPVRLDELYERIEFTPPEPGDELYQPPAAPAPAAVPPHPYFGMPPKSPEGGNGAEQQFSPQQPEQLKPNIVEKIGAAYPRKVSFALDYGEEPEPGETLRFVEAKRAAELGIGLDRGPVEEAEALATEAYFADNASLISGVKWISVVDDRTTEQCLELNNKRWNYPSMTPRGHGTEWPGFPPIKWNCRSTVRPIIRIKPTPGKPTVMVKVPGRPVEPTLAKPKVRLKVLGRPVVRTVD